MSGQVAKVMDFLRDRVRYTEEMVERALKWGWTPAHIPNMQGKVALVTGSNSGIGFEICRKLAENGCMVYMVSRALDRGLEAAQAIKEHVGAGAQVEVLQCDMSALANVAALIQEFKQKSSKLDILVTDAGVFYPGPYTRTVDNIELTLAVNFYAHATLVLGVLDVLQATPGSRVVNMASVAEQLGRLNWENLRGQKWRDSGLIPYCTSKLYGLMFMKDLSERVDNVDFFMVHPGLSITPLRFKMDMRYLTAWLVKAAAHTMGVKPYQASFSALYAATEPQLAGKHWAYYGPNYLNMFYTTERQPWSKWVRNPVSCWKLFEETVRTIQGVLGPDAAQQGVITVPPHPETVRLLGAYQRKPLAEAPAGATNITAYL